MTILLLALLITLLALLVSMYLNYSYITVKERNIKEVFKSMEDKLQEMKLKLENIYKEYQENLKIKREHVSQLQSCKEKVIELSERLNEINKSVVNLHEKADKPKVVKVEKDVPRKK